jgi:PAS domain S-box-containing protein
VAKGPKNIADAANIRKESSNKGEKLQPRQRAVAKPTNPDNKIPSVAKGEAEEEIQRLLHSVQQEKDRLAALINSIPDEIWFADSNGKFTLVNPAGSREFALADADETDIRDLARNLEVYRRDGSPRPLEEAPPLRALRGEVVRNEEEIIRTPVTGEMRYRQVSSTPVKDTGGNIIGAVSVVRDITDRERAKAERDRLNQQRQLALNADRMGWWHYDPVTRVATWDKRYKEIFEVSGYQSLNEEILARLHPDDLPHVWAAVEAALNPADPKPYSTEFRVNLPGDRVRWVEAHGIAMFKGDGENRRATGFVGTVQDITGRKKTEEEMRKLNKAFKALSDSSQATIRAEDEQKYLEEVCRIIIEDCGYSMVWIGFAEDDEAKSIRPAAYAGFEKGYLETLALTWSDTERGRGPTGTAIRTGKVAVCRNMLTDPAFAPWREQAVRRGYASSIVFPLQSEDKVFGAITIYSREADPFSEAEVKLLTELADNLSYGIETLRTRYARMNAEEELHKLAEDLKRSNTDLQQFAYAASHDLQEPLRGIAGFAGLLEKRYKGKLDKKADEFIDLIVSDSKRMQELIKDLLEYSRIDTKPKLAKPVNCAVVVEEAFYNLRAAVEETGTELTYDSLPIVAADPTQLKSLFQNLIGNAIKFRRQEKPRIHISAEQKGNEWVFSVKDNGIGFESGLAERIFVVFQRLHTRQEYPGTGIGLAICKKIVERHGGRIWAESEPGKGSTFYFTLPVTNEPE